MIVAVDTHTQLFLNSIRCYTSPDDTYILILLHNAIYLNTVFTKLSIRVTCSRCRLARHYIPWFHTWYMHLQAQTDKHT